MSQWPKVLVPSIVEAVMNKTALWISMQMVGQLIIANGGFWHKEINILFVSRNAHSVNMPCFSFFTSQPVHLMSHREIGLTKRYLKVTHSVAMPSLITLLTLGTHWILNWSWYRLVSMRSCQQCPRYLYQGRGNHFCDTFNIYKVFISQI